MPTGYTYKIENGEINTGAEFLKLCTRAFGIAADLRDESLSVPTPSYFEPDPHYYKAYQKAVKHRDEYRNITFNEMKERLTHQYYKNRKEAFSFLEKYIKEDARYEKILKEIEAWNPPTSAHEKLKEFAINQIKMSMNTSVIRFYKDVIQKPLDISNEAVCTALQELVDQGEKDCKRTWDRWQASIQDAKERTEWMQQLLESLEENHENRT